MAKIEINNEISTTVDSNRLFWVLFRPQTLEECVLIPRIKTIVEQGIKTNLLFTGTPGLGKSTLAKILVKKHNHLELNSKLGVEVLRNEIQNFCSRLSVSFDEEIDDNACKVVYIDEFDAATPQLQEELRAFIEKYEKHVRFIATANNISKISPAMLSRFTVLNFNPQGIDELRQTKIETAKMLMRIVEQNNLEIDVETVKEIVRRHFPDLRKCVQQLQVCYITGQKIVEDVVEVDVELFKIIINKPNSFKTWEYLYANWHDRMDTAFNMLGKDLFYFIKEHHPELVNKTGDMMEKVSEFVDVRLQNCRDPFLTLYALVISLQKYV
jgi:DNA polymerase III delta prime subunit